MAGALQCPACGHKHRLDRFPGAPTFRCARCRRMLRTPPEFRRPEPGAPPRAGPGTRVRPLPSRVQRGGAAATDRTAVLPAPAAPARAPVPGLGATRSAAPLARRDSLPVPAPLRALVWVLAVGLSGVVVFWTARQVRWLSGDRLIDMMTGHGFGRYSRVLAVVPVWALLAAVLATVGVEAARTAIARRRGVALAGFAPDVLARRARGGRGGPARAPVPTSSPRARTAPVPPGHTPTRPPAAPNPVSGPAPPPRTERGDDEVDAPAPEPAQRPRRIPRRGVAS